MLDELKVKIAVVDDHPMMRDGIVQVLMNEPQFTVIAEGADCNQALEITRTSNPDIIILDLGIPGCGMEALKKIRQRFPNVRCVILTANDSADTAIRALNAGAKGYILKGVGGKDFIAAIWTVAKDASFVSPEFAMKLLEAVQSTTVADHTDRDHRLSHRESQILREVEGGLSNKLIADKLQISEKTVKYYMSSIMQKYGVTNRVGAVMADQKSRLRP